MENKGIWKKVSDTIKFGLIMIGILMILFVGTKSLIKLVVVEVLKERPTVYMVYGDKNTCIKAVNAQGGRIPCSEAMKDGNYHIEWNAPKTLNEN